MVKNSKGFTLVELLAVIVILAVILVIAVPSIMSTITESRKGALASSAKLIASSAETAYISNQTLGIEKTLTCQDVSNYNETEDYTCDLQIEDGKAKVTLIGKGKFEGMRVCSGTKEDAVAIEKNKCLVPTLSFSRDSWATIKAAVTAGDTENYHVGDTKTIELGELGTHTVRIANMSACPTGASALASETACGFVIEFADIITTRGMNSTGTNAGGWPGSAMYDYVNGTIYNALVSAIGDIIIPTTVVSGSESGKTSNYTTEDKVYLLSTREVYGKKGTSNQIYFDGADGDTITRQLDWYEKNGVTTSSNINAIKRYSANLGWWLRSAYSGDSSSFYTVINNGNYYYYTARTYYGVSPAFRLG